MKKKMLFVLILLKENKCSIFIVISIFVFTSLFKISIVDGTSMNPTLQDKQVTVCATFLEPKDQDIIVIDTNKAENWPQYCKTNYIIKRYYERESSPDHYFVRGDNAEISIDSRYVGEFDKKSLVGVVILQTNINLSGLLD